MRTRYKKCKVRQFPWFAALRRELTGARRRRQTDGQLRRISVADVPRHELFPRIPHLLVDDPIVSLEHFPYNEHTQNTTPTTTKESDQSEKVERPFSARPIAEMGIRTWHRTPMHGRTLVHWRGSHAMPRHGTATE